MPQLYSTANAKAAPMAISSEIASAMICVLSEKPASCSSLVVKSSTASLDRKASSGALFHLISSAVG